MGKLEALRARLRNLKRIVVCFSGGADSTFILHVAKEVLNDNVLAVTAVSEVFPLHEQEAAERLARSIGVVHHKVMSNELANALFTANPENRCYHCKSGRFRLIRALAQTMGIKAVVDGANFDDLQDYRPGMQANREQGIISPLCDAGLGKAEIRQLSRQFGLPTWNKPALACLASRIACHQTITAAKLKQIDDGETYLRRLKLAGDIRVRHHGPVVRLEVSPPAISVLASSERRDAIVTFFQSIGFDYVTLDLQGYVRGSLNREILQD
jgi:pyridinium-3,5-biscarboxylic acid mononucleotide sulfurtransferase